MIWEGSLLLDLILRRFIPNYTQTADNEVRRRYGTLAGITGIILNLILFAGKQIGRAHV